MGDRVFGDGSPGLLSSRVKETSSSLICSSYYYHLWIRTGKKRAQGCKSYISCTVLHDAAYRIIHSSAR